MTIVWGHRNRSLLPGSPELLSGPYVRDRDPAPGQVGVAGGTNILLTVASGLPRTVVVGTIVITLAVNGGTPVTVFTASTFQAGYAGTTTHVVTSLEDAYDFVIDPDVDLPSNAAITIRVLAQDDLAGSITPPEAYTFFTAFVPPVPPVLVGGTLPDSDTLRGGKAVVAFAQTILLDTTHDAAFAGLSLPAAWTGISTGSGSATPTYNGLVLDTGLVGASTAAVASVDTFLNYDMSVEVLPVFPEGVAVPVDLAVLEVTAASGATARVRLRRGVGLDPTLVSGAGDVTVGGVTTAGGVLPIHDAAAVTLRMVRNGARLFGFVGDVQVLDIRFFALDAGVVRLRAGNLTFAGRVRTVVRNFRVRSHVTISSRLIDHKIDVSTRRLAGNVPAAPIEELGLRDVVIFGLFGEIVIPNGFLYVLPPERTLGLTSAESFVTVQDPVLKDG